MSQKTYIPSGETVLSSQIGATLEALAGTIAARREAGDTLFTRVETNEYPSGLRNRGFSERRLLFSEMELTGCFHNMSF